MQNSVNPEQTDQLSKYSSMIKVCPFYHSASSFIKNTLWLTLKFKVARDNYI